MAGLAVDVAAVPDPDDEDDQLDVLDAVNDAINALANPVAVRAGELFTPGRAWGAGEPLDPGHDALAIFAREGFKFFDRRRLDEEPIACHDA
jgi:hypothetical protein